MHLAAVAYHMTGDDQYRSFLFDELIGRIHALDAALITEALNMPRWCQPYYGQHITFSPLWSFIASLTDSSLRDQLRRVMNKELWGKAMFEVGNAKFDLMFAGSVPESVASARSQALSEGLTLLAGLGGDGGLLDDPRRTYTLDRPTLLAMLGPSGIICPTEEQRHLCEDGIKVFGVTIPGQTITGPCTGAPGECMLDGGVCAPALAKTALPVGERFYQDFLWQRSPFEIGADFTPQGTTQSPGLDVTEEYWLARDYGFITAGAGQVLAWRPTGASCTH
jgi:hypothetical protein